MKVLATIVTVSFSIGLFVGLLFKNGYAWIIPMILTIYWGYHWFKSR
jgi:hypothetical protein